MDYSAIRLQSDLAFSFQITRTDPQPSVSVTQTVNFFLNIHEVILRLDEHFCIFCERPLTPGQGGGHAGAPSAQQTSEEHVIPLTDNKKNNGSSLAAREIWSRVPSAQEQVSCTLF